MYQKYYVLMMPLLLLSSCYDSQKAYTSLSTVSVVLSDSTNIYADSATLHKVTIILPGLRAQNDLPVDLNTDWGTWPNKSQTLKLTAAYQPKDDVFKAETYLLPGRTVQHFNIKVTANAHESVQDSRSIYRYPSKIQLVADSSSLAKKPGSTSAVRVYFTSDIGFPSYGLRFVVSAVPSVNVIPSQFDLISNKPALTRVTLLPNTTTGSMLTVSGQVASQASPQIIPATILLRP